MAKEELQEEELQVCLVDEDGNEFLFWEEMIIPVGDVNYALLLQAHDDEDEHEHSNCECGCGCEEEEVVIAKIVKGADGEDEYDTNLTDEEFEAVKKAYDALFEEAEQE